MLGQKKILCLQGKDPSETRDSGVEIVSEYLFSVDEIKKGYGVLAQTGERFQYILWHREAGPEKCGEARPQNKEQPVN